MSFPQEEPVKCSLKQFHNLRWIIGSWRGWISRDHFSYERFTFLNDSTIREDLYLDSAMTQHNDEMIIKFRNENIFLESANGFWVVVKLDSTSVLFSVADRSSHYLIDGPHILFNSIKNGTWTRNYYGVDKKGKHHSDIYHTERIK